MCLSLRPLASTRVRLFRPSPALLLFIHTSISGGGRKVCFVRCRSAAASEISCLVDWMDVTFYHFSLRVVAKDVARRAPSPSICFGFFVPFILGCAISNPILKFKTMFMNLLNQNMLKQHSEIFRNMLNYILALRRSPEITRNSSSKNKLLNYP